MTLLAQAEQDRAAVVGGAFAGDESIPLQRRDRRETAPSPACGNTVIVKPAAQLVVARRQVASRNAQFGDGLAGQGRRSPPRADLQGRGEFGIERGREQSPQLS
ncbi:hypothetical protein ACFU53_39450 [Streptomyces sp. NPDC057474]|uniref:hypothetical protein n=1 Tax=Streptomyces sp. NPDC057474 TaxID=3346144 RepID=UPI0036764563